jgi:hypothetical protein
MPIRPRLLDVLGFLMPEPKPEKPGHDESSEFVAAVRQGLSSLDKGRAIPYEKIRRWLLSWGTDKELPPPECE